MATNDDLFDRLVDHVVSDALEVLPSEQQKEIVIRGFGLRDGVYQTPQEIGKALRIPAREVRLLATQALQAIMTARREGQLRVGGSG